jgi:tRNA1(Val) A37 N6-methylase TrmN6
MPAGYACGSSAEAGEIPASTGPASTPEPSTPEPTATTEDAQLGGRVRLRQPARGYRAAIDPVFLAAATPAGAGDRVLDLGTGVGAVALCLLARVPDCRVTGLERQADLAALARANAALNGAAQRFSVVEADLLQAPDLGDPFDLVVANPPYLEAGRATPSPRMGKALADMESQAGLDDWIAFCGARLRPGGEIVLIHRADRLDAVLTALAAQDCGGTVVFPLWPRAGSPARRVLVSARRRRRGPLVLAPGLILHEADGRFTAAAEGILRHAAALPLRPEQSAGSRKAGRDAGLEDVEPERAGLENAAPTLISGR